MSICKKCGAAVQFRHIDGWVVPLGCQCFGESERVDDYDG